MPTNNLTGIVVKTQDFDDDDMIVTVISHDEVLSFIALGVRKLTSKNRVALQLGNIIEVEIFRARLTNKLSKLKKAVLIKQPPLKEGDTALVLLEIIKFLSRIDKSSDILFNRILEGFSYFSDDYNHHVKTFILFGVLDVIGVYPKYERCIECNRHDRINGFDFYKGGYTCVDHTENKKPLEYLKAIKALTLSMNMYKDTDALINKYIYNDLVDFIKQNIYV